MLILKRDRSVKSNNEFFSHSDLLQRKDKIFSIKISNLNFVFDNTSNSVTLGAGINLNKNLVLDFAYAAMFYAKRKITNDVGSPDSINGKYSSFINVYMATLTFKI